MQFGFRVVYMQLHIDHARTAPSDQGTNRSLLNDAKKKQNMPGENILSYWLTISSPLVH
jgi:hypothetical protein